MRVLAAVVCALGVGVVGTPNAAAFCGFYAGGAGADLFNNATQVVLMRVGTKTVLSMQNNYEGPTQDFAMVVPVPVVLSKDNVKTLPRDIFARVDKLAAPRMVEYWEKDPCVSEPVYENDGGIPMPTAVRKSGGNFGVKVEAQFEVGEYEIVILSASESTGLENWLSANKYTIPKGASSYLQPYVTSGSKFFVAKVNAKKVKFDDKGMAMLSPLRVNYDSEQFSLPIRLGMMNAKTKQDLIVHILAPGQRYEVKNYKNVTIPTNLDLKADAKGRFGEFYVSLFDRTLERNPGAVVTEYSWDASTCDPCPEPPLRSKEVMTLGGDVVGMSRGMVLTRMHARYAKDGAKDDLIFTAAEPIMGGREVRIAGKKLEEGARPARRNNFQARYAIRYKWTGKVTCDDPQYGRWGPPRKPQPAVNTAFAKRDAVALPAVLVSDVPELGIEAAKASGGQPTRPPSNKSGGCAGCDAERGGSGAMLVGVLFVLWLTLRRRAPASE